jgi:hypothetical protein
VLISGNVSGFPIPRFRPLRAPPPPPQVNPEK